MQQTKSRDNLVCPPLKLFEHFVRVFQVLWFAEKSCAKAHERVSAKDESVRKFFGDRPRLSIRIDLRYFLRRQFPMMDFLDVATDDFEIVTQLPKQFRPPWRHRCK